MEKIINFELKKVSMQLQVNGLSLNIDKKNFVVFHPFNKPLKYRITLKIDWKAIMEKSDIKYLGIIVDSTLTLRNPLEFSGREGLTWKQHILHFQ